LATDDFFRSRLDQMIDLRHPLAVLARGTPWAQIGAALAPALAHKDRAGTPSGDVDLFSPSAQLVGAGVSAAGRPPLSIRPMASLLYLKHAFNLCDEEVVKRWAEDVVWQYFSDNEYYEPRPPCDATQVGRFRRAIGEVGVEEWFKAPIDTEVATKAVRPNEFAREGKSLRRRAGCYAYAKQYKRLRRVLKRQRMVLGIVLCELQRKPETATTESPFTVHRLQRVMERAERIRKQQPKDKNKLYAIHAPEVECIGKGKARQPYEFGVKASIAVTHRRGLIVGARTFPGNPYDKHILAAQLEQTNILLKDVGRAPKQVVVDLGYRGVDADNPGVEILHRGRFKSMTSQQRHWLKRRQAIGHLKADHRMNRCWLAGPGRCAACGAVRGRLQPALVAGGCRSRAHQAAFFRPLVGSAAGDAHRIGVVVVIEEAISARNPASAAQIRIAFGIEARKRRPGRERTGWRAARIAGRSAA